MLYGSRIMKFVFTKNISCDDSIKCDKDIQKKIEDKFGIKLHTESKTEKLSAHLSVFHKNNNHQVWLFLYSKKGVHESESNGKTVYQNSDKVEKFVGTIPSEAEIKKAI